MAVALFIVHVYFNNRYGYFRDEFDYLSCADHLQWGYVDQPPLIPFLVRIFRFLLGDSLRAIRFFPALASSLLIVQTAVLARELGGRKFAMFLAAICALVAPQFISNGSLLGTNSLEPNLWMGCVYFAILAIKRSPRFWLWFGVFAGLGLEEKYTIALFGLGIALGLLLSEQRRVFLNRWIWLGALAAFLIFLPNVLWNIHYHWPFLQLLHNIRADGRDVVLGPVSYFFQQLLIVNPATAIVWLPGLFALFFLKKLQPYRFLGWAYLFCYTALFLRHGKNYYLSPIYPMLMAAGAIVFESASEATSNDSRFFDSRVGPGNWILVTVLLLNGIYLSPLVIPMFSPQHFVAYMQTFPVKLPLTEHFGSHSPLPQWYSDQFGWKEIADEAAVAWSRIPTDQRRDCGIFAQNYGQAGAIDFFYGHQGLPPALSGDRTFFLWGPRGYSGNCMLVVGDRRERLEQLFNDVEYIGTSTPNPWAQESERSAYICRQPKFGSLSDLWPKIKHWR